VIYAGQQWICDVPVSHFNATDVTDISITDTLPAGLTFVAHTMNDDADSRGAPGSCAPQPFQGPGDVVCGGIDVDAFSVAQFQMASIVSPDFVANTPCGEAPVTNTVCIATGPGLFDPDLSNNCDADTDIVKDLADLVVTKVSKSDTVVRAGQNFPYTIYVRNFGPSYPRGVRLRDLTVSSTPFRVVTILDDPVRTTRREAVAYNGQSECLLFDWQIGSGAGGTQSGSAVFAVPFLAKGNRGVTSELAITNLVPKPGFTDFVVYIYDQNGRLDQVCQKLNEKQVEYIDLATWGWVNPNFLGSAVVSAVFWEHDVFSETGTFTRNLVGLGGVAVERVGGTQGGPDVPGDESKAFETFPIFNRFLAERQPRCPGVPGP